MTHEASTWLRMLEPVVRPVDAGASSSSEAAVPLERRDFESLLADATAAGPAEAAADTDDPEASETGEDTPAAPAESHAAPLARLSGIDAMDNASLRALAERSEDRTNRA